MKIVNDLKQFNEKKVGILGGTFDPIHNGHIHIADQVFKKLKLDTIFFIPAKKNPLKTNDCLFSEKVRLNLLEAALADKPNYYILDFELKRTDSSYTYNTILEIKESIPKAVLFLIIGEDNLLGKYGLANWYKVDELLKLVQLVVCRRLGSDNNFFDKKHILIEAATHPASATKIREQIKLRQFDNLDMPKEAVDLIKFYNLSIE